MIFYNNKKTKKKFLDISFFKEIKMFDKKYLWNILDGVW